jgi:glycosyltransferase involved in cell wall biosynthesis
MLISVCIPHYNRSKYLLTVLESIRVQDYPEVEVIISDDCSTDDSAKAIPNYISALGSTNRIPFHYIRQAKNLGYDGNLRASLGAGTGEYLFTLGNDDALPEPNTLSKLVTHLENLKHPDVAIANFHNYGHPEEVTRRARITSVLGSGPELALKTFRSFSFVGGLAFKNTTFKAHDTSKYDGSVYSQIYLGARIISAGGTLATIAESMVAKDVTFSGELVNSYVDTLVSKNRKFHRHTGGLDEVGRVTCDAILPYFPEGMRQRVIFKIYAQLLLFTYSFWLFKYREHKVYKAAVNVALGCMPTNLVKTPNVAFYVYAGLTLVHAATTIAGLLVPVSLLRKLTGVMSRLSKKVSPQIAKPLTTELTAN